MTSFEVCHSSFETYLHYSAPLTFISSVYTA